MSMSDAGLFLRVNEPSQGLVIMRGGRTVWSLRVNEPSQGLVMREERKGVVLQVWFIGV